MNLPYKIFSDVGVATIGLTQSAGGGGAFLASQLMIAPARMVYVSIPAKELRNFVDGMFPNLATNRIADCASGFGHRYRAGHDLLFDVPSTFVSHGPFEGLRQAGHIIATDFPTKAGIPIPGFSNSGFGQLLEQAGISNGWLQMSLFDGAIGILAIAGGHSNLMQAFQGALSMDFGTACQTFGIGTVELALGIADANPLLAVGGLENILAGVVSTWKTFSIYVNPLDLLGAAGASALLGFGVAYGLAGESLSESVLESARSGTIGALFAVSSAFGFGALAGFVTWKLGSELAKFHNSSVEARLTIDEHSYKLLIEELCAGNVQVKKLIEQAAPRAVISDRNSAIKSSEINISAKAQLLSNSAKILNSQSRNIVAEPQTFNSRRLVLEDDYPELSSLYKTAFRISVGR